MLSETDQQAVVQGLRRGETDAWSALYKGYCADVWRYVAQRVGPESSSVADVVQETFLAAARTAQLFDPERGTLWAWLTGIAHHHSTLYWRQINKSQRLKDLVEAKAGELRRWFETAEPAEEIWQRQELAMAVRGVLAELSADYSALLTAKYLDEQSLEDLAAQLGGSVEAIKSRLARARREFRSRMETLLREPVSRK